MSLVEKSAGLFLLKMHKKDTNLQRYAFCIVFITEQLKNQT